MKNSIRFSCILKILYDYEKGFTDSNFDNAIRPDF